MPLNDSVTRFIGDVFVYLSRRGGTISGSALSEIGTIPRDFLRVLVQAQNESPSGENTIVLSHSMGGQIVYDAVTRFLPDYPEFAQSRAIDLWCACASQVGLFEEMKLFLKSDQSGTYPQRVSHPRTFRHVDKWLNVWDRNDILSYTAKGIFADMNVDDREFLGGGTLLNGHGAYIQFASTYRQSKNTLPPWNEIPAWRIALTLLAFVTWAFAVKPGVTKAMFGPTYGDLAAYIAGLAIIVVGPILSAVDNFLNPSPAKS